MAMHWGIFDVLGDVGAEPKTSTQLAEVSGADPRLVGKLTLLPLPAFVPYGQTTSKLIFHCLQGCEVVNRLTDIKHASSGI